MPDQEQSKPKFGQLLQKKQSTQSNPEEGGKKNPDIQGRIAEAIETASGVHIFRQLTEPGTPPPPLVDPGSMVKTTFEAARDISKDEREDRRAAEKDAKEERMKAEQAKQDADARVAAAHEKIEEEREGRFRDWFEMKMGEMNRITTEFKEATEQGNRTTATDKVNEFVQGIEAMQKAITVLTPKHEESTKARTSVEQLLGDLRQLDEVKKLLIGERIGPPMVSMSDLANQLPAPFAIELKKIELEDARMRDQAKDQVALEERKRQTSESIIGLLMGIGTSVMEAFSGSAPEAGGYPAVGQGAGGGHETAPAPSITEVSCPDCGKSFYVRPETAKGPLQCPFCTASK